MNRFSAFATGLCALALAACGNGRAGAAGSGRTPLRAGRRKRRRAGGGHRLLRRSHPYGQRFPPHGRGRGGAGRPHRLCRTAGWTECLGRSEHASGRSGRRGHVSGLHRQPRPCARRRTARTPAQSRRCRLRRHAEGTGRGRRRRGRARRGRVRPWLDRDPLARGPLSRTRRSRPGLAGQSGHPGPGGRSCAGRQFRGARSGRNRSRQRGARGRGNPFRRGRRTQWHADRHGDGGRPGAGCPALRRRTGRRLCGGGRPSGQPGLDRSARHVGALFRRGDDRRPGGTGSPADPGSMFRSTRTAMPIWPARCRGSPTTDG